MSETYSVLKPAFADKLIELVRWWERLPDSQSTDTVTVQQPIYFRNDSGVTIPPYAAVQLSGTIESGVLNYSTAKRPFDYAAVQSIVVFNNAFEVLDGEYGSGQVGPVFTAIHDAAITYNVGDRMGWKSNAFTLGLGAPLVFLGLDDVATNACKVMWDHSCMTGQSVLEITSGSAGQVHRRKATSGGFTTDTTRTYFAYNDTGTAVAADSRIKMFPIDGRWVIVEVC
jgi:hypothetical protein